MTTKTTSAKGTKAGTTNGRKSNHTKAQQATKQEQPISHVSAILSIGATEPTEQEHEQANAASAAAQDGTDKSVATGTLTKPAKPVPTLDEALTTAKAGNPALYANVIRVVSLTTKGAPKRVVIECGDPQTKQQNGVDVSVCEGEREIAVQDLFQVSCCAACADRKVRKARRNRQKAKVKAATKMVRALKASK